MSLDLFAAKLRLVVEGTAPQVYQDANKFFANTFATDGIKTLIWEVWGRLISKTERIANIAEVLMAMSNEEAHYWFGKIAKGNRSNIRRLCLVCCLDKLEALPPNLPYQAEPGNEYNKQ